MGRWGVASVREIWVLVVVSGAVGSVHWIVQPLGVVAGCLTEGVVLTGDNGVEPCTVWFSWGHVADVWAVEAVISGVVASKEASATALVSLEL